MPEKDMSRLIVERTATTIGRLRSHMSTQIPYGPKKMKLTPKEARLQLQALPPEQKRQRQLQDPEAWDNYMRFLYGR